MDNITPNKPVVPSTTTSSTTSSEQTVPAGRPIAGHSVKKVNGKSKHKPSKASKDERVASVSLSKRKATQPVATTTTQSSEEVKEMSPEAKKRALGYQKLNELGRLFISLPADQHGEILNNLELQDLLNLRDRGLFNLIESDTFRSRSMGQLNDAIKIREAEAEAEVDAMIAAWPGGLNGRGDRGKTLLHNAALSGNLEHVRILINKGLDINARDDYGSTILHAAAYFGSSEVCKFLIDKGLDINAKDAHSQTVLHAAATSGSVELCQLLIDRGADINAKGYNGRTVLHEAFLSGSVELCLLFINNGADTTIKDNSGRGPFTNKP